MEQQEQTQMATEGTPDPVAEDPPCRMQFEFDGEVYAIVPPKAWPAKVLRYLRTNDFVALLECVIGVEQYQRFEDSHTIGDVERFVLLLQEAMGGNS